MSMKLSDFSVQSYPTPSKAIDFNHNESVPFEFLATSSKKLLFECPPPRKAILPLQLPLKTYPTRMKGSTLALRII